MKLPTTGGGIGSGGAAGIALMVLHLTGHITGWAWPILYIFLILAGIGQENRTK